MRPLSSDSMQPFPACRSLLSAVVMVVGALGLGLSASHAMAQVVAAPGASLNASSGPSWSELSAAQKAALKPLAGSWAGISAAQKRKWIALSQNYPSLPPAEQAKLHSRMDDWASLSAAQRNQARLNFAETKQLSPDQKKSKWEAYQALTPQEKQKLATGSPATPAGAALAVTPVPRQKLADVPPSRSDIKGQQLSRSQKSARNANALALQDQPPLLPLYRQP
jgi:Protein of unknown function (DUF3106)